MYDSLALIYPLSSHFLHRYAHKDAIAGAEIGNGMNILEVATGSGEMFRRLARINPDGLNVGCDFAHGMAARTHVDVQKEFPGGRNCCQVADARFLPFADNSFDAVIACYLVELLPARDLEGTLAGFHRVLRPGGRVVLILIGEDSAFFNFIYRIGVKMLPSFWGDQIEERITTILDRLGMKTVHDKRVRQLHYPSRVLVARRS
jgi:ubiquinone/menaquinone biosynthesis C-methylase UbiE